MYSLYTNTERGYKSGTVSRRNYIKANKNRISVKKRLQRYENSLWFNLLNPTGHVMHQQFNIQQLYVLPTPYLCVLYLSENKQRLVPLTA